MLMQMLELVKNLKGKLFLLGIYDKKIYKLIEDNDDITDCMIFNHKKFSLNTDSGDKGRMKSYPLRKIRKLFRKKTVDSAICDYSEIHRKMWHFVKNSIRITKGNIYIYCEKETDIEDIKRRYNRYKVEIQISEYDDCSLIMINCSKAKEKRFKEMFWIVGDLFDLAFDYIGDILVY